MARKLNEDGLEERVFPGKGGYPILIENKESILKTIDDNIIDKEIALMILEQLETDAKIHLENDEDCIIPCLAKIKRKLGSRIYEKNKEVIEAAKETMSSEDFNVFTANLMYEEGIRKNNNKVFQYQVSRMANKNGKSYYHTAILHGKDRTNIRFYCANKLHYSEPWTETD